MNVEQVQYDYADLKEQVIGFDLGVYIPLMAKAYAFAMVKKLADDNGLVMPEFEAVVGIPEQFLAQLADQQIRSEASPVRVDTALFGYPFPTLAVRTKDENEAFVVLRSVQSVPEAQGKGAQQ